jgi:hypothetical protein
MQRATAASSNTLTVRAKAQSATTKTGAVGSKQGALVAVVANG